MLNSKSVSAIGPFNQIRSYSSQASHKSDVGATNDFAGFRCFYIDISQETNCETSLQSTDIYRLVWLKILYLYSLDTCDLQFCAQGAKPLKSYILEYENDFFLELIPSYLIVRLH